MSSQSTKHSKNIEICPMLKKDIEGVLKTQIESNLSFWSAEDYEKEIEKTDSICKVAAEGEEIIGFIVVHLLAGSEKHSYQSAEIYNIAVKKNFREKGIGQRLFDETIRDLKNQKIKEIWLEVRKSNKNAVRFYCKNGFEKQSERKNYYQNPREDALIFLLKL